MRIRFHVFQDGEAWVAYCRGLDIATQASTRHGAIVAGGVAARLFIGSCVRRGVMWRVLRLARRAGRRSHLKASPRKPS